MRAMPVLLLLLALSACSGAPGSDCALVKVATLPLEFEGKVPVVPVQINGHPARMVLDTGSDGTVLTQAAAARLGITAGPETKALRGAGGAAQVGVARAESIGIGGDVQRGARVSIADIPRLAVDGLLGIDVLIDYEMDLDVPNKRVTFYRARGCIDARPDFQGRIIRLPTQQQAGSGHIFVSMSVDGQPLRGMLDSGASTSTLSLQSAEDAGLSGRRLAALPQARGVAVNKEGLVVRVTTFREMRLGDDVLPGPQLTIADIPAFAGDVLVGEDYIGTRRLWFSFRLGRVYVERGQASGG